MAPITVRDLQRAIRARELDLVYQPEVDLRTGHIAAVEALVRWHHPVHGTVLPPLFVPLAERAGQVAELSEIVLDTALAQAAEWSRSRWDGAPLPIWLNLSACELAAADLHHRILTALDEHDVAPTQLGLEITETAPIADTALAAVTLHALHDEGIRVAIDDFGTGYSSLSHLKELPVDVVKIDRSFVAGIAHEGADASIVASITDLAHALRRTVIAEGVEDSIQQRALAELGCDLGQGYLFASPQPPRCVEILLAADRELAAYPAPAASQLKLPQQRRVTTDVAQPIS
ncbi:MAG TPA: EAL domain-containing protein [Mycobacteriales bacterium]|nr:EAL domain-containing protein [Mycobacteriales bacterium]